MTDVGVRFQLYVDVPVSLIMKIDFSKELAPFKVVSLSEFSFSEYTQQTNLTDPCSLH